jgi:hypothetical protein
MDVKTKRKGAPVVSLTSWGNLAVIEKNWGINSITICGGGKSSIPHILNKKSPPKNPEGTNIDLT